MYTVYCYKRQFSLNVDEFVLVSSFVYESLIKVMSDIEDHIGNYDEVIVLYE